MVRLMSLPIQENRREKPFVFIETVNLDFYALALDQLLEICLGFFADRVDRGIWCLWGSLGHRCRAF